MLEKETYVKEEQISCDAAASGPVGPPWSHRCPLTPSHGLAPDSWFHPFLHSAQLPGFPNVVCGLPRVAHIGFLGPTSSTLRGRLVLFLSCLILSDRAGTQWDNLKV